MSKRQSIDRAKAVTISASSLAKLQARIEELEDELAFARTEGQESFPDWVARDLIARKNPIRIFRKHRKMTLKQLSDHTAKHGRRVDVAYLSQIETGKKPGSISAYKALAAALKVDLDMLV